MVISVITVCHNSKQLLTDYVDSFLGMHRKSSQLGIEFIFVENSQDQGTEEHALKLRSAGLQANVYFMKNNGFGAACNLGAQAATGEVLIFANPDIRFLSDLAGAQESFRHPPWGTVRQVNDHNRVYSFDLLPEYRNLLTEALQIHRFMHALRPLRRFTYPVGSFMFVGKELFQRSGGFNERFFLYFEEAELSRRLVRLAGPASYLEDVSIWHKGLGTQPSRSFTLREEARGFVTYCAVTGQEHLVTKRIATLRRLSPFSETAQTRAKLIETAWKQYSTSLGIV